MVGFGGGGGGGASGGSGPTAVVDVGETGARAGTILGFPDMGESFSCWRDSVSGLQGSQHLGDGDDRSNPARGT